MIYQWPSQQDNLDPLYAKVKLKYNFVETPSKFITAKLSIRKLGFSALLALIKIRAYESKALRS